MLNAVDLLEESTYEGNSSQSGSEESVVNLENSFKAQSRNVFSVKCAAHTLQLRTPKCR